MITGFDNYTINQPNNKLVTHLGLGSLWKSPISGTPTSKKYSFLGYLFLNALIRNIFKSGHIHRKNPFYSFQYYKPTTCSMLPQGITHENILKFYRVKRSKIGSDLKLRSAYVTRNYRHYLDFAPIGIFVLGNWCLLLACTYLPYIHRKSKPLRLFKKDSHRSAASTNLKTYVNLIFQKQLLVVTTKSLYCVCLQLKFTWTFIAFFKKFNYYPPSTNLSYFRYSNVFNYAYLLNLLSVPSKYVKLLHFIPKLTYNLGYTLNTPAVPSDTSTPNMHLNYTNRISFIKTLLNNLSNLNYLFSFFCEKLNKRLYKFSNYKKPRFSIKYIYIPKYRRFKHSLNILVKTFTYLKKRSFNARLLSNWTLFMLNPHETFFLRYMHLLQHKVFHNKSNRFFRKR